MFSCHVPRHSPTPKKFTTSRVLFWIRTRITREEGHNTGVPGDPGYHYFFKFRIGQNAILTFCNFCSSLLKSWFNSNLSVEIQPRIRITSDFELVCRTLGGFEWFHARYLGTSQRTPPGNLIPSFPGLPFRYPRDWLFRVFAHFAHEVFNFAEFHTLSLDRFWIKIQAKNRQIHVRVRSFSNFNYLVGIIRILFDFNCLPGNEIKTFVHGSGLYKNNSCQQIYPGTRVVRSIRQMSDFKKALHCGENRMFNPKKVEFRRVNTITRVPGTSIVPWYGYR